LPGTAGGGALLTKVRFYFIARNRLDSAAFQVVIAAVEGSLFAYNGETPTPVEITVEGGEEKRDGQEQWLDEPPE
jgi:hypothetical protein